MGRLRRFVPLLLLALCLPALDSCSFSFEDGSSYDIRATIRGICSDTGTLYVTLFRERPQAGAECDDDTDCDNEWYCPSGGQCQPGPKLRRMTVSRDETRRTMLYAISKLGYLPLESGERIWVEVVPYTLADNKPGERVVSDPGAWSGEKLELDLFMGCEEPIDGDRDGETDEADGDTAEPDIEEEFICNFTTCLAGCCREFDCNVPAISTQCQSDCGRSPESHCRAPDGDTGPDGDPDPDPDGDTGPDGDPDPDPEIDGDSGDPDPDPDGGDWYQCCYEACCSTYDCGNPSFDNACKNQCRSNPGLHCPADGDGPVDGDPADGDPPDGDTTVLDYDPESAFECCSAGCCQRYNCAVAAYREACNRKCRDDVASYCDWFADGDEEGGDDEAEVDEEEPSGIYRFEGEDIFNPAQCRPADAVSIELSDAGNLYSQDAWVMLRGTQVGDRLVVTVHPPEEADYIVTAYFTRGPDFGRIQLWINGDQALGNFDQPWVFEGFASEQKRSQSVQITTKHLRAIDNVFIFELIDDGAGPGFWIGLDVIRLVRI